jgi:aldehyde:ferredoxin oxidoreductase
MVCHLAEMLKEYYEVRNWTSEGIPRKELLDMLDLV